VEKNRNRQPLLRLPNRTEQPFQHGEEPKVSEIATEQCQPASPGKRVAGRLDLVDRAEVLRVAKSSGVSHLIDGYLGSPVG
jgi:hypothetical protein